MVATLLSACLASLIASQTTAGRPAAGADITGRVIDGISGAPVAEVTVTLLPTMFPAAAVSALEAVTDADGSFAFHRLAPGRYRIQAQKMGFAAFAGPFDEHTLDVAAGQSIAGLELALRPGGTLTGRIVGANGGPVAGLTVSALRLATGPGGQPVTAQMAQTSERGEFQLNNLPEGQYVIIACPCHRRRSPRLQTRRR
jgi:5-hydroxyisourate hydrolase-like protein (transthyretin family)